MSIRLLKWLFKIARTLNGLLEFVRATATAYVTGTFTVTCEKAVE
jgi:hypothetical protein